MQAGPYWGSCCSRKERDKATSALACGGGVAWWSAHPIGDDGYRDHLFFLLTLRSNHWVLAFLSLTVDNSPLQCTGAAIFQFSCSVRSDSLPPHGLQHTRHPCPSPTPGIYSNSHPLSWWCHPNHLILCCPLLLPPVFPSVRVFSNELVLRIR